MKVYKIYLTAENAELAPVTVKTVQPVKISNDTLSFHVGSFKRIEDRSIGDVLKHIPGVQISEEGQISYNGKNITNFYIGGDDLMNGRYGLAIKSINKEIINRIDIIKNHQPISVLKDKLITTDIAVNLDLKDPNTIDIISQTSIEVGLPKQRNIEADLMLLNQKIKTLNSLKINNTGIDYRDEFKKFREILLLNDLDISKPDAMLALGAGAQPPLPKNYYYFNNSGVLNGNVILNTRDTTQLKLNFQVFVDKNSNAFSTIKDNFLTSDTISYSENKYILRKPIQFNIELSIQKNKKKSYLHNQVSISKSRTFETASLSFNNNYFDQSLIISKHDFSNTLTWIPMLKKNKILSIRYYTGLLNQPQNLNINKGIDSIMLNAGKSYLKTRQSLTTPVFFQNLLATYLPKKISIDWQQVYEFGVSLEMKEVNSTLFLKQFNGNETKYLGDSGNSLKWVRKKIFFKPSLIFKKNRKNISLLMPITLQDILYSDIQYNLKNKISRVLFAPSLNANFRLTGENFLSFVATYKNNFGNTETLYKGAILKNYLSFTTNDIDLPTTDNSSFTLYYDFQKPSKMITGRLGLRYNFTKTNNIFSTKIENNISRINTIPFANTSNDISFEANISKYYFSLKSKISASVVISNMNFSQKINNQITFFTSTILNTGLNLDIKLADELTLNYNGKSLLNIYKNNSTGVSNSNMNFDQDIILNFITKNQLVVSIKSRLLSITQPNSSLNHYFFADCKLHYSPKQSPIDWELNFTNLLNISEYKSFYFYINQAITESFQLRGRMGLLRMIYRF